MLDSALKDYESSNLEQLLEEYKRIQREYKKLLNDVDSMVRHHEFNMPASLRWTVESLMGVSLPFSRLKLNGKRRKDLEDFRFGERFGAVRKPHLPFMGLRGRMNVLKGFHYVQPEGNTQAKTPTGCHNSRF